MDVERILGAGFNLADPGLHITPELDDAFRLLRASAPVAWHAAPPGADRGFWVLTRYRDVATLGREKYSLSSVRGNMFSTLLHRGDGAANRMLTTSDDPVHARFRRVIRTGFGEATLQTLAPTLGTVVDTLLDQALEQGECDFARTVCIPLSLAVVCELLGVPQGDRGSLCEHLAAAVAPEPADGADARTKRAQLAVLDYYRRAAKAGVATTGMLAALGEAIRDPELLDREEFIANCYNLSIGGAEATPFAMSGGLQALILHPRQRGEFMAGGTDLDLTVEEVLRWSTPPKYLGRTLLRDITRDGVTMPAGDVITGWYRSANFDPDEFDHPMEVDFHRSPNRHLSFGLGQHYCIGAGLARMELRILLQRIRARRIEAELVSQPVWAYSNFASGFHSLPVRLHAR